MALDECIGLLSIVEDGNADRFRQADLAVLIRRVSALAILRQPRMLKGLLTQSAAFAVNRSSHGSLVILLLRLQPGIWLYLLAMDERNGFRANLTGILARSLAEFTFSTMLWLIAVICGGFAFLGLGLWLGGEEELFLAPWWMRIVQGLFIAVVIALSYRIARHLPATTSRYTGQPSTTSMMPYIAAVFCFLVSHGVLWGGLHRLHPGREITLRGTVTASGRRHGKASRGHGDWVDLQLQGRPGTTHLETNENFAVYSDNGAQDTYQCSLNDARPGDTFDLRGNQSQWGFAVTRFIPINQRLLQACSTSR